MKDGDAQIKQDLAEEMGLEIAIRLRAEFKKAVLAGYAEAGVSGLCEEGRFEVALGALETLPLDQLVADVIRAQGSKNCKMNPS
jgi:hypothetical protein